MALLKGGRDGAGRRPIEPEVLAVGGAGVLGAEDAALLEQRHDLVGEPVEPAWGDVRDEDEAVAWTCALRASATVAGEPVNV